MSCVQNWCVHLCGGGGGGGGRPEVGGGGGGGGGGGNSVSFYPYRPLVKPCQTGLYNYKYKLPL